VPLLGVLRHSGAVWFRSYCLSLDKMPFIPCLWPEQEGLGAPLELGEVMMGPDVLGAPSSARGRSDSPLLSSRLELHPCNKRHKDKSPGACRAWSCGKPYFSVLSTVRMIKALLRGGNNNYSLELASASEIASPPL